MASQSNKHKLNTFHLFAGAGGGILADLLLGHNPIGACEIEPYPRDVLLARQRDGHLPNFPIWDDVCSLDGTPWRGSVDVLCGGFPCQDISAAGKGAGISGERSKLWKEYSRLIGEMQPRFVFAENSPLLRTRGLGVVLKDLASLGYNARWGLLGSRHIGASNKRDRLWLLAYTNSFGRRETLRKREVYKKFEAKKIIPWKESPNREDHLRLFREWATEEVLGRDIGDTDGVDTNMDKLKAIGNGQDCRVAATVFNILSEGLI